MTPSLAVIDVQRRAAAALRKSGMDAIDICAALGLRRWMLLWLGEPTGPWTGTGWNAIVTRRGFPELVYVDPLEEPELPDLRGLVA